MTIDELFDLFRVNSISVDEFINNIVKNNLKVKLKMWEEFALVSLLDINRDGFIEWSDCWSIF